jgi:chlorophyll(ide) b reductase
VSLLFGAGDNVFVCSRNDAAVKAVTGELEIRHGTGRVFGRVCNVSKSADVQALVDQVQRDMGDIDIWINNAGSNAYSYKPLIDAVESDLVDIVDTNVLGVMLCCQAAIKRMRRQKAGGHVFNMDGAGADGNPTPRFAAYGATKRALAQLSKSIQAELKMAGIDNVGLHNLSPGMVTTELLMSGSDTAQAKFFINCLAETPDVVADFLVPRIREVPSKQSLGGSPPTGLYIKYLTPVKAYSAILSRLVAGTNKNRFISED